MTITKLSGIVAALGVLAGSTFAIDGRYVHAEDFKKQVVTIKQDIADLRRSRIEDEIFKIELVAEQKRTQSDKALLERYKNQLKEIDARRPRDDERGN